MNDRKTLDGHTFGLMINGKDECLLCPGPHGGPGPCDHRRYSRKDRRYVFHPNHYPAYVAAHYNPNRSAASHELERMKADRKDPPRGHLCWCVCPRENPSRGYPACSECRRYRQNQKAAEPVEIGRTGHVTPPTPSTLGLDIALSDLAA